MAQFAVFGVQAVPDLGTTTHALVYRGDHASEAAAVQAAADIWGVVTNLKVWACGVGALTQYNIATVQTHTPTVE